MNRESFSAGEWERRFRDISSIPPEFRTAGDVEFLRRSPVGCCDRNANNHACDCMAVALSPRGKADPGTTKETGHATLPTGFEVKPVPAATTDAAAEVARDMLNRRAVGLAKYGKLVDPADVTEDWLQHHYEELLDACVYVKAEILRRKVSDAGRASE